MIAPYATEDQRNLDLFWMSLVTVTHAKPKADPAEQIAEAKKLCNHLTGNSPKSITPTVE